MKQEEINKNNKLIAGFDDNIKPYNESSYLFNDVIYSNAGLRYHSSWDWLMPVVEKIESLHYSVNISSGMVYINGDSGVIVRPINIGAISKKKAIYEAVIKFINWYNENK